MDSEQLLLELYREHPCRTLPNAFWKSAKEMAGSRLSVRRDSAGSLTALSLWRESRLMGFWCANPKEHPLTPRQIAKTDFALVHGECLEVFDGREFSRREPYFRLIHRGKPQVQQIPPGYTFENVQPDEEVDKIVGLIQSCYRNMNINAKIVKGWLEHPVYAPNLWIWIVDAKLGKRVGLGIAERDRRVPEASLEWVQVLPSYQKKGLGKAIVAELLMRAFSEVDFITVSGKVNSITHPEMLYRRCGFTGSDVWWLLAA